MKVSSFAELYLPACCYCPQHEHGDAGEGDPLTLVCTDVEGSTELWEWDNSSMMTVCCKPACKLKSHETCGDSAHRQSSTVSPVPWVACGGQELVA